MPQQDVDQYYDNISEQYDSLRFGGAYYRNVAQMEEAFVVSKLGDRPGKSLEIGPGTGRFTRHLSRLSGSLTVCDISSEMLERTRTRLGQRENIEYRVKGIESLSELSDYGNYDVAVAMRILSHVPDWRGGLTMLCGSVHPGGLIIFDLWNRHSYIGLIRAIFRRRSAVLTHRLTPTEIREAVAGMPVEIADTFRWGYPRIGALSIDRIGSVIAPSLAYSTVFCCRRT